MKGKLKQVKGITLIALVITIIVLLILAGVSIAMLTGQNGILTQANNAKVEQSHGAVREGIALAYNEYQIEINTASNTKLASTETVQIQGKEEKALASYSSFLDFLNSKGYIKEGTTDVLDVEALTGSRQALGNGTDTDVYKIEEQDSNYVVNYYDEEGTPQEIWNVSKTESSTEDASAIKMLIVTDENGYALLPIPTTEKCIIDWGDGNVTNGTETEEETIAKLPKLASVGKIKIGSSPAPEGFEHKYEESNSEYVVTISGKVEVLTNTIGIEASETAVSYLKEIIQWGETGLRGIDFEYFRNLTKIVQPTEKSFENLEYVGFSGSAITSIPDRMFANCTKITSFERAFEDCGNLETIGDYAFSGCSNVTSFEGLFASLDSLTKIGNYVFSGCNSVTNFNGTFAGCGNLQTIGEGIFDGCENVTSYVGTFADCTNLTGKAPELWLLGTNSKENNYQGSPDGEGCFYGCTGLDNYDEIPDYWKDVDR